MKFLMNYNEFCLSCFYGYRMESSFNENGLLLIKANGSSFSKFENYLRGRGWQIHGFGDALSAVGYLLSADIRPRFALLSVDQPLNRITGVCEVLRTRYGLTLVGYSAMGAMSIPREIEKLGIVDVLPAPVSGPAFERLVRRIRFHEKRKAEQFQRLSARGDNGAPLIRISGSGSQPGSLILTERLKFNELSGSTEFNDRDVRFGPALGSVNEMIGSQFGGGAELRLGTSLSYQEKCSLLMEALEWAMERLKSLTPNGRADRNAHEGKRVNCLIVNVYGLGGYIVCGADDIDASFERLVLQNLANDITEFLKKRGVEAPFNTFFPVELQTSVRTHDWWSKKADFMKTAELNGQALAAAFFNYDRTVIDIYPAAHQNFMGVKVAEVDAEHTIGFNLYLHLPVNQRYFLYTRKGRMLLERQKTRLMNKGVNSLCVRIEEVHELIKLRARVFLTNSLREYVRDCA